MDSTYTVAITNRVTGITQRIAVRARSRYFAATTALALARYDNPRGKFEVWEVVEPVDTCSLS
jgi:hypothetical protein